MKPYVFKEFKRPKYGNRKCTAYGRTFDSVTERDRYLFLLGKASEGLICNLECQVRVKLTAYGQHICDFIPDFRYTLRNGQVIWEDVKSEPTMTDVFRIKRKLFHAMTGIALNIVMKSNCTTLPEKAL
jgi:hypothetical protein